MILETNIEIIHRLYQTGKGPFEEMLSQLMALYEAIYTPVRIVVFGAPQNNEEYCERFNQIWKYGSYCELRAPAAMSARARDGSA